MTAGIETKRGICGICPAGCWIEADIEDGRRLVDLRADDSHTLGMICHRGRQAPSIVHSEHRLSDPLRRKGPKGTYEFEPITWDDAYDTIVENLNAIKAESGPEATAIYTGRGAFELSLCDMFQPEGVAVSSASNVLFPFGSPNTMGVGALCYVSFAMIAPHITMGRMLVNTFTDIENAELLLVWGTNPATDSPPLDMIRLEAAARRGARIVVIDPRNTETVKRTGAEWVPIRPGTDGALALAMINVLIESDVYDADFAENWCYGFDVLITYVGHFTPEVAESITGIPATRIRELALSVVNATGACPVTYTGLEYSNSGIQAIRAMHTLFALAGQLDVPGGIGFAMPGTQFPINRSCNVANPNLDSAVSYDRFPIYSQYRGESHASGLVDSVLKSTPYRIRALIIHGASILTSWPETPLWKETLAGLDFQVCIDRQLTADAAYADIVLPATTMFEIDSYMVYGPIFRLRERLIEPVGEARNDYLIMAELAARLGYGELFPQSEEEMIRFALEGSGYSLEDVREAGGSVKLASPMMEYQKWRKGGLRADGKPGFETPTGLFEIKSTILEEYGYEALPKYVEPVEGPVSAPGLATQYPLVFNSGARPNTDFRSQHHGIESLLRENPEPTVDINIEDAGERGIEDGDLVEVRTPRGAVQFRARATSDIVKGAIEANMGGGGPIGPQAWQESNVNDLTDLSNHDEISGFPVYKALLCDVVRVAGRDRAIEPVEAAESHEADSLCAPVAISAVRRSEPERWIYLDNNATTFVDDAVRETMLPFLKIDCGNPSSIHGLGRAAKSAIDESRRAVARLIGARPREIVFTGGGSEADNLAIKGAVAAMTSRSNHLVTSAIEHPAILAACRYLETTGWDVTYLDPDEDGLILPSRLEASLTDQTALVSVMLANNEVGTIQPIAELAKLAHEASAIFHTDAVQAVGKIPVDVNALGVDMASLSAHKFHGPKGVGALYVRKGTNIEPLIHGGKQEVGVRAGTENVAAIAGMGKAAELAMQRLRAGGDVEDLRDRLEERIRSLIPEARLNGDRVSRLPNTLNLTLPGLRGESLVIALDRHGIALSSGSACKSGSPEPTHVLMAMGRSESEAHCSVRFSLSDETTAGEIDTTISALADVLEELETTIRFLPCK